MQEFLLRSVLNKEIPTINDENSPSTTQRRFTIYKGQPVLIDPKTYGQDPEDEAGELVEPRVVELAGKLSTGQFGETMTLQCRGYFEVPPQFCFVYNLPPDCPTPESPNPPPSLFNHLSTNFKPSQTDRLRLAHRLARLVASIHVQSWLHKGIRSENILFFPSRRWGEPRNWDNPRLVGLDFARKDGPHQYSEKSMRIDDNIYRHPDALRNPTTSFLRIHDYYALGIVLVEIARCCTIQETLRRHAEFQQSELREQDMRKVSDILLNEHSLESYPRKIRYCMGDQYWNVVRLCLTGDFGGSRATPDEIITVFFREVVEPLGRMAEVMSPVRQS